MNSIGINVKTHRKKEIIDITQEIQRFISTQSEEISLCHIFVQHTTAAITTADLDPGTDMDYLAFIEHVTPKLEFQHPHDPEHAPDHIWASLIGPDVIVPVTNRQLGLGTWQRIVLCEMDGPRERSVRITVT